MPDVSMHQTQYRMIQPQQIPMPDMSAAHSYGTANYSMQNYSNPINGHLPGQVYDPQLESTDSHMAHNDLISDHYGASQGTRNLADQPPDMLQFWLSQADDNFGYGALSFPAVPEIMYQPPTDNGPMQPAAVSEVSDATSTSNIPNERFARVEACWKSETDKTHRMGSTLWDDVIASPGPNLFTVPQRTSIATNSRRSDSQWGIGPELKQRLEMEFGMTAAHETESAQGSFPRPRDLGVPPPEVLEICLDAYFRRFHPLAPFVHVPTFNANATPLPLLYAMCLVGLSAVKQSVGGNYMKHAFRNILRRVMRDLAANTITETSVVMKLSTYAAGCLTLNLAALSGDHDQIALAQALHASLLSSAQKEGLFSVEEVRIARDSAMAFEGSEGWAAWSRLETVKRITVSLLTSDWWFSSYSSTSPLIRPESISICIPAHNDLFKADSCENWQRLGHSNRYRLAFPLLRPRTFHLQGSLDALVRMEPPLHEFGQYTLMSVIKLCQCDAQHRHFLITDDWDRHDHLLPWRTFQNDTYGRSLVCLSVGLSSMITANAGANDLNASILWHNICMTLTANTPIFELAAGRSGAGPASKALADIKEWTQTPSARRACLHAAHVFKLLHHRKVSDPISINALTALFYAGLVLGLYLFVVPGTPTETGRSAVVYDVLDDVDWTIVGDAGMAESSSSTQYDANGTPLNGTGARARVPAVAFIEHGGTISFGANVAVGGYMSARRMLLDFAHLMDEMGVWKPKVLSKILHIMSDVLEDST